MLLSSALIAASARGDLWFDEIWSIYLAREAGSAVRVLQLLHDNNHPLSTLYVLFLGDPQWLWTYRALAVVSGIASLMLAAHMARSEWGHPEALCSVVLMGTSYPLLLYFSEARGYGPAMALALASAALLRANMRRFRRTRLVVFWLCAVLGMLAHATFVIAMLGLVVWSLASKPAACEDTLSTRVRFMAKHHALPLVTFGAWYLYFLRRMTIGGGDLHPTWGEVGRGAAFLLGLPDSPLLREAAVAATLLVVLLGAVALRKDGSAQWALYPGLLLAAALLIVAARDSQLLQFRYFVVVFPFLYMLLARLVCRLGREEGRGVRLAAAGLMLVLVCGQLPRDYRLLVLGRGDYSSALQAISQTAPGQTVYVGSDHDFRNRLLFDFYTSRMGAAGNLRYAAQPRWSAAAPEWFIAHSQDSALRPQGSVVLPEAGSYRLVSVYGFSGVSGWRWFVYRRVS